MSVVLYNWVMGVHYNIVLNTHIINCQRERVPLMCVQVKIFQESRARQQ